jgi:hypothetical protein
MEDQTAQNPILESSSNPVPVSSPPPSRNWILMVFSILVLLLLISAGYLYYQNQQLKTMLATYQSLPSPAHIPTTDPTENWKVYTNNQMGFSLRVPSDWFTHPETKQLYGYNTNISYPVDNPSTQDFIENQKANISIALSSNNGESLDKIAQSKINSPYSPFSNETRDTKIDGENAIVLTFKSGGEYLLVNHGKNYYSISGFNPEGNEEINTTIDQIISTFKFIEIGQVCTQEAKICPDGSSVGRTAPNCEFASCPTTMPSY